MKLGKIIILIIILSSCNRTFFVSKDNIIRKQQGYLLLSNQYIEFIPIKIDTSISLLKNFNNNKIGIGFYLNNIPEDEIKYFLKFADTILPLNYKIVPVEIEYRKVKETNTQLKALENELQEHCIIIDSNTFIYKISRQKIYYINAYVFK